jgi:hypothetical protein
VEPKAGPTATVASGPASEEVGIMPMLVDTTVPTEPAAQTARPSALATVRAMSVVSGGPLLLDALEVLGPVSAAARWPHRMPTPRTRRAAYVLTALGAAAPFLDHGLVRPWLRRWGATHEERERRLPGDPDTEPMLTTTRAVTVDAPAEEVWRWLAQIGQDRGGFYSYDWLENLAGCRIHSADELREDWQQREAGDGLTIFEGYTAPLLVVDPPRALVIDSWGAYVIEPIDDSSCRLIARSHTDRDAMGLAYLLAIELPHAIMERKMLLGIKQRAERHHRARARTEFWEHVRSDLQAGH